MGAALEINTDAQRQNKIANFLIIILYNKVSNFSNYKYITIITKLKYLQMSLYIRIYQKKSIKSFIFSFVFSN